MEFQNVEWKTVCVAKWDQECKASNDEHKRKFSSETTESERLDKEIIHKVKPDDTLQGIALKYHVQVETLKMRNNLSSDEIYFRHQIIVPQPKFISVPSVQEQRQEKIDKVLRKLGLGQEKQDFVIDLLNQTFWNVKNAIQKYNEDIEWQNKYGDILASFENKKHASPFFHLKQTNTI